MTLENKSNLLLESLNIEDIDLETAGHIVNLSADLANQTAKTLLKVYNESVGVQKTFDAIIQTLTASELNDSIKLKTISKLIDIMPFDIYRAATETEQEKHNRIFKS